MKAWPDIVANLGRYMVAGGQDGGGFRIHDLVVVASFGMGWDHVSVSRNDRTPSWADMEFVKRLFFKDAECAMQLHVPIADHKNIHDHCLHIWRPQNDKIPRPEAIMV